MLKFMLLTAGILVLAGCDENVHRGPMEHETKTLDLDKSEVTRAELKLGAGEMRVGGGAAKLMEGNFDYNDPGSKPQVEYHSTGVRSDIEIQPSGTAQHGESKWDVRFNDSVGMDLVVKMGAGEAHLNLGSLNLRSVAFDLGAGQVEADFRGHPKRSYDVRINGGVGQATIHLPKSVGISATAAGGIGEIHVSGLEKRNDRWINPGHENDPVNIRLDVKGGIGQIDVIAE
jgi:uncharacterized protein DUF2154